jgi:release factor glutamine methyltransferase
MESRLRKMPLSPCLDIVDLCCGSGVVAVSLAHRIPNLEVWAVDSSAPAADVTTTNAADNGVGARVHTVTATAEQFLDTAPGAGDGSEDPPRNRPKRFSGVVCNPPYIASSDLPGLPPEVRDHEPIEALDGGPEGLDFYRRIIPMLPGRLIPGGATAFEIGDTQGKAVSALLRAAGMRGVAVVPDYAGRDRVVVGYSPD